MPELTDDNMVMELRRLLALLGDGHSWLTTFGAHERQAMEIEFDRRSLPVRFYHFDDGLYIIDGVNTGRKHIGSRVLNLGALDVEETLERMVPYVGVDNMMGYRAWGVGLYLPTLVFLRTIGVTHDEFVMLTLERKDGKVIDVELRAGRYDLEGGLRRRSGIPTPLYLEQRWKTYWLEEMDDVAAVYVQFNTVQNAESGASIAEFAAKVGEALDDTDARALILDIRHNGGGNNTLLDPFIRMILRFQVADEDRDVFVIAGRETFSAAQNLLNRLERETDAILVGEPTSSRPNHVGETSRVILPYSGIRASISNRYWQDSDPGDDRSWIEPHIPVSLFAADYFSGRDPALETVLELLRQP